MNSLLQTLFHVEAFRSIVLGFEAPKDSAELGPQAQRRRSTARRLVEELRKLFAYCGAAA